MGNLEEILSIMEEQSLYSKESKCEFGMTKILYLVHVVSAQGEDTGYIGLATTQKYHTPMWLLWDLQLLQTVCERFFTVGRTTHKPHKERSIHVDQRSSEEPLVIKVDNQEGMYLSKNPEYYAGTKHIDIQHHFNKKLSKQNR